MPSALKVELVGGDGALAIFLAVLGPSLIAGAAVVAALVARRTANERQAEQLRHDTERQQEQLEHDSERQERQLAHDRQVRDREYLFRTVSAAFECLERAKRAIIQTSGWIRSLETVREKIAKTEREGGLPNQSLLQRLNRYEGEVISAMDEAHPATMAIWSDTALLRLFLGREDDVVVAHIALAEKMRAWYDSVKEGYYGGNRDKEGLAHSKAAAITVRHARRDFEDECRRAFGWDEDRARPTQLRSRA